MNFLTGSAIPTRPRNWDWEKQYIRKRHNRWQARPCRDGIRHNLGTFPSYHDARRAVVQFFEGKLQPLPRFVRPALADGRPCHSTDDAEGFVGELRGKRLRWRSSVFPTREEAHTATVEHLTALAAGPADDPLAAEAVRFLHPTKQNSRQRMLRFSRPELLVGRTA